ncbi:MAG: type II toxin-antitoxin system RelE/ParE family toxin [Myxococcaceae bacterium]|nr:type II toxin-antitoxin system RelE/ParE family toxin [Myxococcaceae bacterium]MCI0672801.1 type II toxin-antitoxin system RelE/ParE family toxin [Myxococcaceae bacterium]
MSRTYDVQWAEVAVADLEELVDFIEREQPGAAAPVIDRLEAAAQRLETLPLRGRVVPELARFNIRLYRELIVRPWRILYRVGNGRVLVVAVLDGRRDLESLLLSRLLRKE